MKIKQVIEGRKHGYDDFGFSLAPGHDEGEPVYNPYHDRTGQYDRKSRYSQDYNYKTGKPLGSEPKKKAYIFYNVKDEQTARNLGLRQTKNGKWFLPADDEFRQKTADKVFGKGRYWEPKDESIAEGSVKEFAIEQVVDQLLDGELDAYDVLSRPQGPAQEQMSLVLRDMYDDVVSDTRLHPDDDFEEILDRVMDRLEDEYGHSGDKGIDEAGEEQMTIKGVTPQGVELVGKDPNSPIKSTTVDPKSLIKGPDGKLMLNKTGGSPTGPGAGPEENPIKPGTPVTSITDSVEESLRIKKLAGL